MEQTKDRALLFGWLNFRPGWFQFLNTPKWFLFFLSQYFFTQSIIVNGVYPGSISTIEKRFGLSRLVWIRGNDTIFNITLRYVLWIDLFPVTRTMHWSFISLVDRWSCWSKSISSLSRCICSRISRFSLSYLCLKKRQVLFRKWNFRGKKFYKRESRKQS